MDSRKLIWAGMFIGSSVGSYVPALWGAGLFSFSSVLLGAIGAFVGIWIGYRLG